MKALTAKRMAWFLLVFCSFSMALMTEAQAAASQCSCIAVPFSKEYQHYSEHIWGTRRQWTCVYECELFEGLIAIKGSHIAWYLGKDDGREGICDGIPVTSTYSNYTGGFIWVPQEPRYFDPIDSSAKDLKMWAKETCR